ncbi:hypothetical protein KM043_000476 [Ampulex compressa]|nr:hypothetical protein KM043_000476 [Ampulex compressa]
MARTSGLNLPTFRSTLLVALQFECFDDYAVRLSRRVNRAKYAYFLDDIAEKRDSEKARNIAGLAATTVGVDSMTGGFGTSTHAADIEDPVERMLKQTGCMESHYQVQECIAENQDWRKCREQVERFKTCMADYQKKQRETYK